MSQSTSTTTSYRPHLSLLEKTITIVAWGLVGAIFMTIGWVALEPKDPLGAVSLVTRQGALMTVLASAGLACVAAAIATIIAGQILSDVGTFAAALGLTVVSLRGGTSAFLLMQYAERTDAFERRLAFGFAGETLAWFVVMGVAVIVSASVMRWLFGMVEDTSNRRAGLRTIASRTMAGYDVPRLGERLFGVAREQQTPLADGLRHAGIVAFATIVALGFLSSGLATRSIQHGQSCFIVAASVCVACLFGHWLAPVRTSFWSIVAVPVAAVLGYLWAGVHAPAEAALATQPASAVMRILPVQYVAVGTAAALAIFWTADTPASCVRKPAAGDGRAKGKR